MAQQQPFVSNTPLQVAFALRYTNANGDIVSQLYPNDYISLIGSSAGSLTTQYQGIEQILFTYQNTLNSLQSQIITLQTSGITNLPQVNGYCLNGNTVIPMNVATQLLIGNVCNYNFVLGTPTGLTTAILAEGSATLNPLPAFSQNSAMAGLTGWITSPTTIADSVNNLWISSNDARAGINKAISTITPSCSQVHINYAVVYPGYSSGFNIYFNGYSFIPAGYIDNGSNVRITDTVGGVLVAPFDIVAQSVSPSPLHLTTSGSTIAPTGPYTVQVNSNVKNTAVGLTCEKQTVTLMTSGTTANSSGSIQVVGAGGCCPDTGNISFTSTPDSPEFPYTVSTLGYTPRFVTLTYKNGTSAGVLPTRVSLTYISGGFTIAVNSPVPVTAINIDWLAFK